MRSLLLLGCLLAPYTAFADDRCPAIDAAHPSHDQLEQCLESRPLLTVGAVLSLTAGGDDGFRATVMGQVDVAAARPVYLSARGHIGSSYGDVDLLVGAVLSSHYGAGEHTTVSMSNSYNSPTASGYSYTTTTTAHSDYVVQRDALVVFGGVRGVRRDANRDGTQDFDAWKTWQVGIGKHYANHLGVHERVELALYGRSGEYGFSVRWFNSLVGMELGWVPVGGIGNNGMELKEKMFYWNFIDFGRFFDL